MQNQGFQPFASEAVSGAFWERFFANLDPQIGPKSTPGGVLGASWGALGRLGAPRGRLGSLSGASWALLGASWGRLGPSWGVLGASWGPKRLPA